MGTVARLTHWVSPRQRLPRVCLVGDCRGVVYLEFLIAFVPLFVLFLGTCQTALLVTARIVVRHAASAAIQSAIVVLEDSPEDYDGAPRGSLTAGTGSGKGLSDLLAGLGVTDGTTQSADGGGSASGAQSGARMVPIRMAAYASLLALSPHLEDIVLPQAGSLGQSLSAGFENRILFALEYLRMASVVTIQSARGSDAVATSPIGGKAEVTIRVTYLCPCSVPFVRGLICRPLDSLLADQASNPTALGTRLGLAEVPGVLEKITAKDARFIAIDAEASLPNQGADFESRR